MTPFSKVYDAFLSRILEDEWQHWMQQEAEQDWYQIMTNAVTWFKFPRVSLEFDDNGFVDDLNNEEIQIIADFMSLYGREIIYLADDLMKSIVERRA